MLKANADAGCSEWSQRYRLTDYHAYYIFPISMRLPFLRHFLYHVSRTIGRALTAMNLDTSPRVHWVSEMGQAREKEQLGLLYLHSLIQHGAFPWSRPVTLGGGFVAPIDF
jgi:hypothetical protein